MSIQDLVNKSLDTIRADMFARIEEVQADYYAKGWLPIQLNLNKGIVRGLIEMWCWGLWQLYLFLALVLKQAFPDSATGGWLDLHCKQVGVTRKLQTKAKGTVYLIRDAAGGNVPIAAGKVVKTKPDGTGKIYRFVTTADVVLPDGALEVAVPVEAEEYGTSSNVTAGQISELATVIDGVDRVENRVDWLTSEGNDDELDEPLRVRYQLAWKVLNGCTKYAYEAWAREVTGVVTVKVMDQHPRGQGTVDVIIVGSAGIPTEQLLDDVRANILGTGNNDEKYPINDDVEVTAPETVLVDYVAQLELTSGVAAEVIAEAENRVRALFSTLPAIEGVTPLGVGGSATRDRLNWACMLPSVKRINTAFIDVPVPENGLAVIRTLTITAVMVA